MSRRALVDLALILLVMCAAVAAAIPIGTVRPFLVFAAALIVPGAALLTLMDVREPLLAVAVAVAVSIAIDIVGSLLFVWTDFWHPAALAIALAAVSVGLLLGDIRRRAQPPPDRVAT
jgi:hypothetical protein